MRVCPTCVKVMELCETERGRVWRCSRCPGHFLREDAYPGLSELALVRSLRAAPQGKSGALCPGCLGLMRCAMGHHDEAQAPVAAQVCDGCDALWFDRSVPAPLALLAPTHSAETRAPVLLEAVTPVAAPSPEAALFDGDAAPDDEDLKTVRGLGSGRPPGYWWRMPAAVLTSLPIPVLRREGPRGVGTLALFALIFLSFIGVVLLPESTLKAFLFMPSEPLRWGGLPILFAMFIHLDPGHLLLNLYYLALFGPDAEEALGTKRFVALCLLGSLVGSILHALLAPQSDAVLIGASDAIFAMLVVACLTKRWKEYYFLFFPIPAIGILFLYAVHQAFGGVMQISGGGAVSYLAHLGGMLVGWLAYRRWRAEKEARLEAPTPVPVARSKHHKPTLTPPHGGPVIS